MTHTSKKKKERCAWCRKIINDKQHEQNEVVDGETLNTFYLCDDCYNNS